jgi:hypothetical protein
MDDATCIGCGEKYKTKKQLLHMLQDAARTNR